MNPMLTDAELLHRYVDHRDQRAFIELVQRHFELVYGAALRRTGGRTHLAAEIAQSVFTDLARKAATLRQHPTLVGWLYRSARYAANLALRAESRRDKLAQALTAMPDTSSPSDSAVDWERIRPLIDGAMDQLKERDREVMLLRHFSGLSFADVGSRLNIAENTARMRHERALGKLEAHLRVRGVTSTTAALSLLLANASFATAPAGLAASVSSAVLASAPALAASAVSASVTTFIMHKLTVPIVFTVLASGLTVAVVSQHRKTSQLETTIAALRANRAAQDLKVEELTRLMSELLELEQEPATAPVAAPTSAPVVAAAPAKGPDEPGVTKKAPAGWAKNGSKPDAYVVGVDRVNTLGGMSSA
ncbi:MAG TPA: sigma-70 family RNA polymerase sigma factor, partial [Opitutus sp.]|nr:sigma-70 family RNA polymerase sigma factor [Opitutus sp.]